tara:strand:+ start:1216 stop:1449 length:234 start_codon:yes stop_codon:yes gene_type:complete
MELNNKDYVTFARRFVKATAENMDVKELRDFYINALHEDIQEAYDDQGQQKAFEEMESWDSETYSTILNEYRSTCNW